MHQIKKALGPGNSEDESSPETATRAREAPKAGAGAKAKAVAAAPATAAAALAQEAPPLADSPESLVRDLAVLVHEHDVAPEEVSRTAEDLDSLNVMEQEAEAEK